MRVVICVLMSTLWMVAASFGQAHPYDVTFGIDVFTTQFGFAQPTEGWVLGGGFDSSNGGFIGAPCLSKRTFLNSPPGTIANTSGYTRKHVDDLETSQSLDRAFSVSGNARASYGLLSASFDITSATSYASTSTHRSVLVELIKTAQPRILDLTNVEANLTTAARNALNNPEAFRQICGDYVVMGYYAGAGGSLMLGYDTVDEQDASSLFVAISGSYGGIAGGDAKISETLTKLSRSNHLIKTFVGFGGITEGDLNEGFTKVEDKVTNKIVSPEMTKANIKPAPAIVVRLILAPWSRLLSSIDSPFLKPDAALKSTLVELINRASSLDRLQRSYYMYSADPKNYQNIAYEIEPTQLQIALKNTLGSIQDILRSVRTCLSRTSDAGGACRKYSDKIVRHVPFGARWKTSESGMSLAKYMCANSSAGVSAYVNPPAGLNMEQEVEIGLFGSYKIDGAPEQFNMYKVGMNPSSTNYNVVFYNITAGNVHYLEYGKTEHLTALDLHLQTSKYNESRKDCGKYEDDVSNPFRILFWQRETIDPRPFLDSIEMH